jgi:hypothetical protein
VCLARMGGEWHSVLPGIHMVQEGPVGETLGLQAGPMVENHRKA